VTETSKTDEMREGGGVGLFIDFRKEIVLFWRPRADSCGSAEYAKTAARGTDPVCSHTATVNAQFNDWVREKLKRHGALDSGA
jgi:hypothetical protein